MNTSSIEKAIEKVGGREAAARAIGVTAEAVRQWMLEGRQIPAKRAVQLAKISGVHLSELRPDLWERE
jgi:DNA-binding transcriptional regulator YdaS (Cro superfamily)